MLSRVRLSQTPVHRERDVGQKNNVLLVRLATPKECFLIQSISNQNYEIDKLLIILILYRDQTAS